MAENKTEAPHYTTHVLGVAGLVFLVASVFLSVWVENRYPGLATPLKVLISVVTPLPLFLIAAMWHMGKWREYSNSVWTKIALSMRGPNER